MGLSWARFTDGESQNRRNSFDDIGVKPNELENG